MTKLTQDSVSSWVTHRLQVVSVIVPVFNERDNVKQLVDRIFAVNIPYARKQTIIVDDGSTDGTQEWLRQRFPAASAADMGVKLICQPRNLGKGTAVRAALQCVEGQVTVILDADLELDPADIPHLVNPILTGDADVVFGNRFIDGRRRARDTLHYVTNKSLTLLGRLITGLKINDIEVGYKAFRTDLMRYMSLRSRGFEIEMELAVKTAELGCRLIEVPVLYTARNVLQGKKFRWKDGFSAVFWLLYFRCFCRDRNNLRCEG
ncbi:MAG: glycosyltransferase family 2 protein [Candidatus Omnitrophica bacterium]|nr:glycosyltransferase family 2 protein [Candidatus Omnitrophota bacterium]